MKCIECGKEIETNRTWQKYCSRKCKNKVYRRQERMKKEPLRVKKCLECGAEFVAEKHLGKKYCSVECGTKHRNKGRHKCGTSKCLECGREYEVKRWRQKYCSAACREAAEKARARKEKLELICPVCGAEFKQESCRQKYCSRECQVRSYGIRRRAKRQVKKKCEECGLEFDSQGSRKYCSLKCRRRAEKRRWNAEHSEPRLEFKECEICGQKFVRRENRRKYCSEECAKAAVRRQQANAKKKKKCEYCGSEFETRNSRRKTCSEECLSKYQSEKVRKSKQAIEKKACEVCGKVFETTRGKQKTCSSECAAELRHKRTRDWKREKRVANIGDFPARYKRRKCIECGAEFEPIIPEQKKCAECRRKPIEKPARSTGKKTLEDWAREAAECGLSYGVYRMQVERFGKTYEELRMN